MDHLNINHEAGRHDTVRAFYFDLLGCAIDPRKADNLENGRKGVWANAGIHQFHLGEGETAQVFDGVITLAYADLGPVRERLADPPAALFNSRFAWRQVGGDELVVTDPWGSAFRLVQDATFSDSRGVQPGGVSEPLGLADLRVHVPRHARSRLDGIVRFYTRVLRCPAELTDDGREAVVCIGGWQTLSFAHRPDNESRPVAHEDMSEAGDGAPINDGAHVSMYVTDLPSAYRAADALGAIFVNHRFSNQAFTIDQAVDQCMFRILDVVDPDAPADGPILRLEHEVRACVTRGGSKYKSCPFHEVPDEYRPVVESGT
jgi:hypothetical protein